MATREEQIRELLMAETPVKRENLEAVPEMDGEAMAKQHAADNGVEIPAQEEQPDAVQQGQKAEKDTDAEEAPEVEAQETEPPTDENGDEVVTIASLAADLEIDPTQLYGMKIPVEGHGHLSIGELKDVAQGSLTASEDAETIKTELAERQSELERKEQQLMAQAEAVAPQELIKAEAELARTYADFAAVDWPQLEAQNPGEAALRRQKMMEAYQIATYNRDQIAQRMESTRGEIEAQRKQAMENQLEKARADMLTLIPEWRDDAVSNREREHMVNYLVGKGINEQTVRSIADPTVIKYLRDSWMRDKSIESAKPVPKPPKVLKPAAIRQAGRGKATEEKRFFNKAKQSKDPRVKDEAVRRLIFGG